MQIIKCWDIQTWDGGDRHNHRYYVATKALADEWMARSKHDMVFEKEFIIMDDLAEVDEYKLQLIRQQALAKLNEQEKKALGLV
jgi:hypothetical protein